MKKVKSLPNIVKYFKELPFYNKHIEKPQIKRYKNIDLLFELPFYEQLNVMKTNHAFRGYAMSYKVEIIDKKDPIKQLEASKSSIKDLFSNLLNETKDFKYQIRLKVVLKNGGIQFSQVYFSSATKTVINHKFSLGTDFQEVLYRIDNWINEGSGWIVEPIKSQYISISIYRPLSGSSYIKLPVELKSPKKWLINIKNKDQKCFLWYHVRHINPVEIHLERITKEDKEFAKELDYDNFEFPVREKDFSKTDTKNNICINVFGYEDGLTFPICVSEQKFENSMNLLFVINENKSHYVYIKDFDRFMFHKTKNQNKKW